MEMSEPSFDPESPWYPRCHKTHPNGPLMMQSEVHLGAIQPASLWRTSPGHLIPDLIGPLDLENKIMGVAGFTWTISGNMCDEICIGELGRKRGQQ